MLLTAGVPGFTRWAALADHLTLRMQLTIRDFLVWVECHIKENKEAFMKQWNECEVCCVSSRAHAPAVSHLYVLVIFVVRHKTSRFSI